MLPARFWLTTGKGESKNSKLESIDAAFMDAGLGYQNHVTVSSIPPLEEINPQINKKKGITHILVDNRLKILPLSSVIHVVKSINVGKKGESIACCIALAKVEVEVGGKFEDCILAFEANGTSLKEVEEIALQGVRKMVEHRAGKIQEAWGDAGYKLIGSDLKISNQFGCVVAFVVFDPFTYKKR
jgi:pyruvoyl-dependent arginine decarboxylase (PvlArgDC)